MWLVLVLNVLQCVLVSTSDCPTWLYPSGDGRCLCGSSLGTVVMCNNKTGEVSVLRSHCLTSNGDGSNMSVVGKCVAFSNNFKKLVNHLDVYVKVLPDIHDQEEQTCGSLNRKGRLCGQCKSNHSLSAYSYDLKCYECTSNVWINILKYICIAYLPLTGFLCVVVVFHISVTSPAMNMPVLYCQLLSLPFVLRSLVKVFGSSPWSIFLKFIATIYGVWNLDFFRTITPPICLPLNLMQLIALDYLVAIYPLLLLVCVYTLVTLHDRGCRLVVRLWKPFLWCISRLRYQRNVKFSIIDAFATFILLSYVKLLNTSAELLLVTNISTVNGSCEKLLYYNDPTISYMHHQHLPYAILAICVLVGVSFPLLLLLFYPMMWFQRCLNKCGLNCLGLRVFVDCFQGYYRDRTDGGWECRYFAVVYLLFRIGIYFVYSFTLSNIFYFGLLYLILLTLIAMCIVQPYKNTYKVYNKLDIFYMICFGLVTIGAMQPTFTFDKKEQFYNYFGIYVGGVFALTPFVFLIFKIILYFKCHCFQNVKLSFLLRSYS